MGIRQDTGLILRTRPLGESDLLIDFFTRGMGRLTALAKGARRSKKRFFGLLLTGQVLSLHLGPDKRGGDLFFLEAASLDKMHLGLRADHLNLLSGAPALELLLRATAYQDPAAGALDEALWLLQRLDHTQTPAEAASALVIHLVRQLDQLGYGLSLSCCLHCGRETGSLGGSAHLSLAGGLVCDCRQCGKEAVEAPMGLVKGLAAAQTLDAAALHRLGFPPSLLRPALGFLTAFWQHALGRDLPALELAQRFLPKAAQKKPPSPAR